jgi:nucleoside-diphosphate-sugar epimerase
MLLITGGTGYLGSELVQQALDQGWEVAATYYSQVPYTLRRSFIQPVYSLNLIYIRSLH